VTLPTTSLDQEPETSAPSCLLIGGESLLVQCGTMLQKHGWNVRGVFSDAPVVREWAEAQRVPSWKVEALDAVTADMSFDWLFSITHLRIVPSAVLARARCGAVNFHDGPLPAYGGLNAPLWALLAGERDHGISWHRMAAAVDAGEVLVQQTFPISDTDTALSLNARCWEAALESFPQLLGQLSASLPPSSSVPLDATSFHRRADRPSACSIRLRAAPIGYGCFAWPIRGDMPTIFWCRGCGLAAMR